MYCKTLVDSHWFLVGSCGLPAVRSPVRHSINPAIENAVNSGRRSATAGTLCKNMLKFLDLHRPVR